MIGVILDSIFDKVYSFRVKSWTQKNCIVKTNNSHRFSLFLLMERIQLNVSYIDFSAIGVRLVLNQIHEILVIHQILDKRSLDRVDDIREQI